MYCKHPNTQPQNLNGNTSGSECCTEFPLWTAKSLWAVRFFDAEQLKLQREFKRPLQLFHSIIHPLHISFGGLVTPFSPENNSLVKKYSIIDPSHVYFQHNVMWTIFIHFWESLPAWFMSHTAAPGPGADRNRKWDIVRDTPGTKRECWDRWMRLRGR